MQLIQNGLLPQELVFGWPKSVLLGDERLIVEQHEGIYACTETEVVVKTRCGLLYVSGSALTIVRYSRDTLVLCGKIERLSYRVK